MPDNLAEASVAIMASNFMLSLSQNTVWPKLQLYVKQKATHGPDHRPEQSHTYCLKFKFSHSTEYYSSTSLIWNQTQILMKNLN